MTLLQIVNKVLRKLRESEVASSDATDYSRMIADFVVDVKKEVEDFHTWSRQIYDVDFTIQQDKNVYDLSARVADGGDVDDLSQGINSDSILMRDTRDIPLAWVTSLNYERRLYWAPYTDLEYKTLIVRDQRAEPGWISFNAGKQTAILYAIPGAAQDGYDVTMKFYIPQRDLETDGTDDSEEILLPQNVVYQGALMYALNERGEEIGEPGNLAERRYAAALAAAAEQDQMDRVWSAQYDLRAD